MRMLNRGNFWFHTRDFFKFQIQVWKSEEIQNFSSISKKLCLLGCQGQGNLTSSYRSFSGRNKDHQLKFDWSVPGNSKLSGVMLGENH